MADSPSATVWTELARQLLNRPDLRPEVREALERALSRRGKKAVNEAVQAALSRAMASPVQAAEAPRQVEAEREAARREAALQQAKQRQALIEHGLRQLEAAPERVPARICTFLRDNLFEYANAWGDSGRPSSLEPAERLAQRILESAAKHQVAARPARVGVLTAAEVSAIETGRLSAAAAPTVRASGDLRRDIQSWSAHSPLAAERQRALEQGKVQDGELLLVRIEPTAEGQRLVAHPVTVEGEVSPRPVRQVAMPARFEPVSAVEVVVAPAVARPTARRAEPEAVAVAPVRRAAPSPGGWRDAAVAVNQARIEVYAQLLEARGDLSGAARQAAERRLARMEAESRQVAGETDPTRIAQFLGKWSRELGRDQASLAARAGGPESFQALSRLGALRHRVDGALASVRGTSARGMRPQGESMVLAQPAEEPTSIFDDAAGSGVATGARAGLRQEVAGERLTAEVVARDAARSEQPSREARSVMQQVEAGRRALRHALTTLSSMQGAGLALSSDLRPLLRTPGMPTALRAKTNSPLMQNVLLPALEQVTKSRAPLARTAETPGPLVSPEALYSVLLGRTGLELAERRPEVARSVLGQMGGLASRLERSGSTPSLDALNAAGSEIHARVTTLLQTGTPAGGAAPVDAEAAPAAAAPLTESAGLAGAPGGQGGAVAATAAALSQEGGALSAELRSRIEPYTSIARDQRVFSGPLTDLALGEMGAAGATIGRDVFLRSDLRGSERTAVAGHELTHAAQRTSSLESQEQQAYAVEAALRQGLDGPGDGRAQSPEMTLDTVRSFFAENPLAAGLPETAAQATQLASVRGSSIKQGDDLIEDLVEAVSTLLDREANLNSWNNG